VHTVFIQLCFEYFTLRKDGFLFPDTQNWELLTITFFACQAFSDQQSNIL